MCETGGAPLESAVTSGDINDDEPCDVSLVMGGENTCFVVSDDGKVQWREECESDILPDTWHS